MSRGARREQRRDQSFASAAPARASRLPRAHAHVEEPPRPDRVRRAPLDRAHVVLPLGPCLEADRDRPKEPTRVHRHRPLLALRALDQVQLHELLPRVERLHEARVDEAHRRAAQECCRRPALVDGLHPCLGAAAWGGPMGVGRDGGEWGEAAGGAEDTRAERRADGWGGEGGSTIGRGRGERAYVMIGRGGAGRRNICVWDGRRMRWGAGGRLRLGSRARRRARARGEGAPRTEKQPQATACCMRVIRR